ncbi:MAG TPA: transcriptional repressor [Rhodospirillaceae bacterium]|nr:MAG: transcriptional repressor [Alphaproteobacteria bacterium GWF2_58_20]HAU29257.1 transcriptional repressor [Rhodospirillaceae bacterium]
MNRTRTYSNTIDILKNSGLRPTRQRLALYKLLFENGPRHVCAEQLYDEASRNRIRVSLATIYNTLHQFQNAGLLGQVSLGDGRAWFDTNTDNHHHFHIPDAGTLIDIPEQAIRFEKLPDLPSGTRVSSIGVMITLE